MGIYFTFTPDVNKRKANYIFYLHDNSWYLKRKNAKEILLNVAHNSINELVQYAFNKKIESYEILINKSDELKCFFNLLTEILYEKDISCGLITTDNLFYKENVKLAERYGITISSHKHLPILKSYKIKKAVTSNFEDLDDEGVFLKNSSNFDQDQPKGLPKQSKKKSVIKNKISTIKLEESFHDKFINLLIESGKDNVEIYKKAGISRQVFSKILSDKDMIPTKLTLVSLCIGLELRTKECKELIHSAGYSLSRSIIFDSIILKYIENEIYDLELINSELDEYGCQLLGWHPRED